VSRFKLIGELPKGEWQFCLVRIKDAPDVVLVVDLTGYCAPRMVIKGKLVELAA